MGLYSEKPKRIVLTIPEDSQELFGQFNKWCIIHGVRMETALTEMVSARLAIEPLDADRTWVSWDKLVTTMKEEGFSLNRTTFWNYRNKGLFADDVRSDGVSTLYDVNAIVKFFTPSEPVQA